MPRPRKKPTQQDLQQIEAMAGFGLNQKQIALLKGISIDTLRKYSLDSYEKGKAKAILRVSQTAYEMAESGKCPAMTMFFLKTQARWTEYPMPEMLLKTLGLENDDSED